MKKNVKNSLLATLSLSAVCALSMGAFGVKDASAEGATLLSGTTVDMYLIAGQSNAVGYSPKGAESESFENVWYTGEVNKKLDGTGANANMGDYTAYTNVTAGQGKSQSNIGPEYGMAKILNDYYTGSDKKALIVKSAAGGTHMAYTGGESATYGNWYPESLWGDTVNPAVNGATDPMGVQYYNFVENFKTVYTELKEEGYTPIVKGMVWMQGCSDVATANYGDLLKTFIDDIRTDIYEITSVEADKAMPFVIGEISTAINQTEESVLAFNETQRNVATAKTNAYTVPSKGLYIGSDGWHFTTESAIGLGERFGRKLVEVANVVPTEGVMVTGASVYVGNGTENGVDKSGIRFQVLAKKTLVENGAEIGALLLPADMTTATELKVDTTVIQNEEVEGTEAVTNQTLAADKWTESKYEGYLQTCVYLYNFPVNDYNREILASAYIKSGENYTYSETISRSMAYVALAAENDGVTSAVGYIKQYNVNYYGEDGETEIDGLDNVGVRYGSLIEKPADPVSATGNKVFAGWYADKACTEAFDFTKAVKGTTNVYSNWIDGYVFSKNGFTLFDDGVAAAGTGWTASAVLKGGNVPSSSLRLERGGIALKATHASGIRRYIFTVGQFGKESGMYLGIVSTEWTQNDNSKAIKLADTYDYTEDITLTVANYNNVLYFKVETASGATYTATYSAENFATWSASAYSAQSVTDFCYQCNQKDQQIGVGGLEAASSTVSYVSYAVGNDKAKAAAEAMGFTVA